MMSDQHQKGYLYIKKCILLSETVNLWLVEQVEDYNRNQLMNTIK